jgi:hypothetical protein
MIQAVHLFATPWWVNLLALAPFLMWFSWRRTGLALPARVLIAGAVFAVAFGLIEASVVVYLRAATGLLPGYQGTLADVARQAPALYRTAKFTNAVFPPSLLMVETFREAATMVVLATVAVLAVRKGRERWAMFLWLFAIWDITYYAGLWTTVRWPESLTTMDVLFLIPIPWVSQVWYPILVSALTMAAVLLGRRAAPLHSAIRQDRTPADAVAFEP